MKLISWSTSTSDSIIGMFFFINAEANKTNIWNKGMNTISIQWKQWNFKSAAIFFSIILPTFNTFSVRLSKSVQTWIFYSFLFFCCWVSAFTHNNTSWFQLFFFSSSFRNKFFLLYFPFFQPQSLVIRSACREGFDRRCTYVSVFVCVHILCT